MENFIYVGQLIRGTKNNKLELTPLLKEMTDAGIKLRDTTITAEIYDSYGKKRNNTVNDGLKVEVVRNNSAYDLLDNVDVLCSKISEQFGEKTMEYLLENFHLIMAEVFKESDYDVLGTKENQYFKLVTTKNDVIVAIDRINSLVLEEKKTKEDKVGSWKNKLNLTEKKIIKSNEVAGYLMSLGFEEGKMLYYEDGYGEVKLTSENEPCFVLVKENCDKWVTIIRINDTEAIVERINKKENTYIIQNKKINEALTCSIVDETFENLFHNF